MAGPGPSPSSTEDIRKMGQLVKIKTNKKKFFVLRDETKSSSAQLEYYDSEKKWRAGSTPKRTIVLKNCFNINAKPDAKHKYAIALYTKDDCFAVSCLSEDEQQCWLTSMIELRNRNLDENTATRPLFEHIWAVSVKSRGLGGNERKVIPGQYRLCLTNKDLSLIRVNNDQSDIVLPLDCIRRCGHTHQFFFLELGRSAITGSGDLWLEVEDVVISQNIHEALLSSMKNNEAPSILRIGPSTVDPRKHSSVGPTGGSLTSHTPKKRTSIYTSNHSGNWHNETSVRKSSLSESSLQNSSGSTSGCRPDGAIEEGPAIATSSSSSWSEATSRDGSDYVPMVTPAGESYMVMSAHGLDDGLGLGQEAHGSNSSVSSVMSSVGSMSVVESSERSFHSLSHLQEGAVTDGGYIEMSSPQNSMERSSGSVRPDVVPCYVRNESGEEFPQRAYSVGSKPVPVANKPLNNSYIDMSGKSKAKKEAEKSSSAPHLNDDDEKKKELSDLFMELDFNRSKRDVKGENRGLRMKATKEAIQRFSIFSRNKSSAGGGQHSDARRPRTSTICQESMRPRTSSFGPSDLRPRSSSGGNACFAEVKSRPLQVGSEQDSLRRHGSKRLSQESVESGKSESYMNMNLGKRSTDRLAKMVGSDAGYMDMKPGEEASESNYMKMTVGSSGKTPVMTSSGESASTRASLGVMMKQRLETVKAGSGEDYLEMAPQSASQSKARGAAISVQPKVKMTKSLGETSSSYMEMAPRVAPSERTVAANSEKKDSHSLQKSDNYLEMSLGSGRRGNSPVASGQAQSVTADGLLTHTLTERTSSLASLPNKEDVKGSNKGQNVSPKEDISPPPFEFSIPLQSFLLYADHTPSIPAQSPASRTAPHAATAASSVDSLELPGQISYATLDIGPSVDRRSTGPLVEGRGTGVIGRGHGSHQHVYAQIDFEKLEDCQK